jgi:predicted NBD/HSP70 family sugar kinase
VYRQPFTVVSLKPDAVPPASAGTGADIQLNWSGWRLGFDLGASDRKVAAVKDGKLALAANGEPVFSEEFVWDPKPQTDPQWHFAQIMEVLRLAEQKIQAVDPGARVQAIGGSSAGVYVNGQVRIASLFRGVQPRSRFEQEVAPLFQRIQAAWGGIPFRIENDGDVTALAGAIALGDGAVLGLAMGSSLAGGYVDASRRIVGWMNELAFAPVDYNPKAVVDEWSRDRGVGANYFSQQAVGRLIPVAGLDMPDLPADALPKRLLRVQERMAAGDVRALRIYETIGRYLGYSVAHYCEFYRPVRHIEILGRVMTGAGGQVVLAEARNVLAAEFPALADSIDFYEPDEREKRHGQAAAAASLPLA